MVELNTMLREHALTGLQTQLDAAVTNGDTAAARKITDDIAKLAVTTAPKAPPFGDTEIRAALETKAPWYGVDPEKTAQIEQFGKTINLKRFTSAEAVADALIKATDAKFAPVVVEKKDGEDGEDEPDPKEDDEPEPKPAKRRTDAPGDGEGAPRSGKSKSGPWLKMSDAPQDVRAEVKRAADKFAPRTEEGRKAFEAKALEAHYAQNQRKAGKK